ncbi:uncharacterized protein LOC119550629 isoform X1 [Drosophila subpulchrella]|uniref:uncharacterized protein LOC119550629 isoform X1 n=1 Tax=Drosophila subpulchrella TaxID=1486046 RepID=UPI0018A137CB|nr:uncharacterized protein LOC119550629 isoform X1 [Drosophila subpulchrella]XP_037715387.1 uncharacterized protein LOC119550629 isoform X1 [Drosophila subpulchrella]
MSLSVASRRRLQTTNAPSSTANPSSTSSGGRYQLPLSVRKQHSFIEPTARFSAQQRGYLSRGLSVGRSIESIRQKLYPVSRQTSLAVEEAIPRIAPRITASQVQGLRLRDKSLVAWSSTTSLLKDQEAERTSQVELAEAKISGKADKNRINLNIVLSQTIRATNEREQETEVEHEPEAEAEHISDIEGSHPVETPDIPLSISPALTVQRRPPLVRAMSAPVRGLDESSKGVIAASKRSQQKLRRRKIFTRTPSSSVGGGVSVPLDVIGDTTSSSSSSTISNGPKKALNRARSVVAPDVITLVSLLSSEGSDSEREDNSSVAVSSPPAGGAEKQPPGATQRRAPLLRKTGKSVSFQDSYPPTFQLASKEYSHMIRRGSIAPLAARIRANRPPTAPPVSIFLTEVQVKMDTQPKKEGSAEQPVATLSPDEAKKENNNNAANCEEQPPQPDHNYPAYVRSLKERECWKLHQKMGAKGVSVSYETVLRGMLTPTEFRHFQRQREQEEARVLEEAEAAEAAAAAAILESGEKEGRKPPATAIERLSEALLQSK